MADKQISRRNFLTSIGEALGDFPVLDSEARITPVVSPLLGEDGYTPTANFYRQQLRFVPQITPVFWALRMHGMVEKPLTLTHDDLEKLPLSELDCTLACVNSSNRNPMIGHARWAGVPMSHLLQQVIPTTNARYAQFYATDGYTTYIETEKLSDALLAHQMNGKTLPQEHGYPARLIVPGLYGYKMPKWIQRIEFTDTPTAGFWETRGWSATGEMQTTSVILTPHQQEPISGMVTFSGIAHGGKNPITQVEISVNDSPWMPVAIATGQPYSWTPWQIDWTAPAPGDYLVKVRASDSTGFTQTESTSAFPNGPTAIHSMVVRVTA
jgi:hypothetical protein